MKSSVPEFVSFEFVRLLLLGFAFLIWNLPVQGQIQQAWVAKYNNGITDGQHQALKMALDPAGNIYVCGYSQNTNGGTGYATLKYAPSGVQQWVARYDSTNYPSAQPTSFALDTQNNLLVTGTAVTVKFDANGNLVWTLPYNAASIATDPSNNVCITGVNTNFLTMKFNSDGTNLWSQSYASTYPPTISQLVIMDNSGNAYVYGYGFDEPPAYIDRTLALAVKYDKMGTKIWLAQLDTGDNGAVEFEGSAMDTNSNIYFGFNVIGGIHSSSYDIYGYTSTGSNLWSVYNPTGSVNSLIRAISVCRTGRIVATGAQASTYTSSSFGTLDFCNGSNVWDAIYPAEPSATNSATSICVDNPGNAYTTGFSSVSASSNDIVTIAYDTNGKQRWLQRYTGLGYGAVGNAIAADNNGNVYVAGYENVPGGGTEMVLIKYSPVTLQHQSNGNFLLEAQGSANEPFDIRATTNLQSWLDLGTQDADTNGLLQYVDTNAPLFPWRFYLAIPQ